MNLKKQLKRLKDTGKIDSSLGGKGVGRVLDMYNNERDSKSEGDYEKKLNDRSEYYWPLIRYAIKHGSDKEYKSNSFGFTNQVDKKGGE